MIFMKLGVSSDIYIPKIRPSPKHKKRDKKRWASLFQLGSLSSVLRKHDQRDKKKVEEKIKMT